jgi:predicted nucleotidyltransferase component of viral defense system
MRDVLDAIGKRAFSRRFYLAGGTALALQLGHRRSVDLDFFSQTDEVARHTDQEIVQGLVPSAFRSWKRWMAIC